MLSIKGKYRNKPDAYNLTYLLPTLRSARGTHYTGVCAVAVGSLNILLCMLAAKRTAINDWVCKLPFPAKGSCTLTEAASAVPGCVASAITCKLSRAKVLLPNSLDVVTA